MRTDLARLSQLSTRYARYGQSLPALALALGGVVMLLLLLAPPLIGNSVQVPWDNQRGLLALAVAALLALWILAKEWMRARIYQSLGLAESLPAASTAVFIRILAAGLAALALAYPVKALLGAAGPEPTSVQVAVGLTACWALPWATLRFIRGWQEGLLWAAISFWALALVWILPLWEGLEAGKGLAASVAFAALPLAYLVGLAAGLVQHLQFLRLVREIRAQEPCDE